MSPGCRRAILTRDTDFIALRFPQERIQSKKKTKDKALGDQGHLRDG